MNDILDEALNSSFVSPQREYKGEKLAPYTEGSRLLLVQCRADEDTTAFFIWAFLYIHIQLEKNRKEAIKLAWDKDLFREKLIEWITDKTEDDRIAASNLVTAIVDEVAIGQVEAIPSQGNSTQGN